MMNSFITEYKVVCVCCMRWHTNTYNVYLCLSICMYDTLFENEKKNTKKKLPDDREIYIMSVR